MATKDRRPTRADARRNYELLISAARAAFMEHGAGAPLDDIAKRAGVGSATLYRHFPTRDDLLGAVLQDRLDGLLTQADALMDHPCPADALAQWLHGYLGDDAVPRGTAGVFIKATAVHRPPGGLSGSTAAIHRAVGRLLGRAKQAGQIRDDTEACDVVRLVNAIGIAAEQAPDPAGTATRMLDVIMRGMRTPG